MVMAIVINLFRARCVPELFHKHITVKCVRRVNNEYIHYGMIIMKYNNYYIDLRKKSDIYCG